MRVPRSVGCIDLEAFKGCSKLMEVTLPKSLTRIEVRADLFLDIYCLSDRRLYGLHLFREGGST